MKRIKFPDERVKVHGIPWFYDEGPSKGILWRAPQEYKAQMDPDLWATAGELAGARLRFRSDTTAFRMKVTYPNTKAWPTATFLSYFAITLYADGMLWNSIYPLSEYPFEAFAAHRDAENNEAAFQELEKEFFSDVEKKMREFEIFLPTGTNVEVLELVMDDDAELLPPVDTYVLSKPIYIYGDSVVHGASAHPGMTYPAIVGRMLNTDMVNAGYSGCAKGMKGEMLLAAEMAKRDAACYVLCYGANTRDPDLLEKIYYPFLKVLKDGAPDTPVVVMSLSYFPSEAWNKELAEQKRRYNKTVVDSFEKGLAEGMEELYYLDAYSFLDGRGSDGTTDTRHLSDAGSYWFAEKLSAALRDILKI